MQEHETITTTTTTNVNSSSASKEELLASIMETCASLNTVPLQNLGSIHDYKELIECSREVKQQQTEAVQIWMQDFQNMTTCLNDITSTLEGVQNEYQIQFDCTEILSQMDQILKKILQVTCAMTSFRNVGVEFKLVALQFRVLCRTMKTIKQKFKQLKCIYDKLMKSKLHCKKKTRQTCKKKYHRCRRHRSPYCCQIRQCCYHRKLF